MSNGINQLCGHKSCSKLAKNQMKFDELSDNLSLEASTKIEEIEKKAATGTSLMVDLHKLWLEPLGFSLATPSEPGKRGGHIILTHPEAKQIAYAMRKVSKVVPDYREPNAIRLAISPLATSYYEVFEGFRRLKELVASGQYLSVAPDGNRVT